MSPEQTGRIKSVLPICSYVNSSDAPVSTSAGYTSFSFDISPYVRPGENVIAVRVEHEEAADSRWYTGSGIDRHVLLSVTDPVAFPEHGIFAVTEEDDGRRAVLRISYQTTGADAVRFRLISSSGKNSAI